MTKHHGILPEVLDFAALNRDIEKREAEERALEQAAAEREQAAAERKAEQEALQHQLEGVMLDHLREAIQEELAADQKKARGGKDKRSHEDFVRFKAFCQRWSPPLSHLPAAPASVAAFLTSELDKGRPHLRRLIKSISTTHHKADLPDPCTDLLVRALLRLASDEPSTQKGN
jgi:hypothetical protein